MKKLRKCAFCGKRFKVPLICSGNNKEPSVFSKRKTCSMKCSKSLANSRRAVWGKDEMQFLEDFVGTMPLAEIVRRHENIRESRNWPARSKDACRARINKLNLCLDTTECLCLKQIAKILEISRRRVYRMEGAGLKIAYKSKSHNFVHVNDLEAFAEKNMQWFSGAKFDNLFKLFYSADLCRSIVRAYPKRVALILQDKPAQPILCTTTGKRYKSIYAASLDKDLHLSRSSIFRSLQAKVISCGYRFEYIE